MNRSLDFRMMMTIGSQSPLDKSRNCRRSSNTVPTHHPKSPFSSLTRNQGTSIPGDNMDNNKVLLCSPNLDQILAGLSSSNQNNQTILLYGVTKE
jgi:hypothetical protein